MLHHYTTYSVCRLLRFILKKNYRSEIRPLVEPTLLFCVIYNSFGNSTDEEIKADLMALFKKVTDELLKVKAPEDSMEIFLLADILSRLL